MQIEATGKVNCQRKQTTQGVLIYRPFAHFRQCVGAISIRFFVEASTQVFPFLRTGNTSAWLSLPSITQTSRSLSDGAIDTGNHCSDNL